MIEERGLTVVPGFIDTHSHLIFARYSAYDVPVDGARSIAQLVALLRARGRDAAGEWIGTSAASQQSALVERRMPTAAELDQAATTRPIVVKRGGHNDVVNSACLTMARITRDTPDPALGVRLRAVVPLGDVHHAAGLGSSEIGVA